MKKIEIYRANPIGEKVVCLINKDDFYYAKNHYLNGNAFPETWLPPKLEVYRPSGRLNDFIIYSEPGVLVCSERAKSALRDIVKGHVDIRYLIDIKGKPYHLMKILEIRDCLDYGRSDLLESSDTPGSYISFDRLVFKDDFCPDSPIFTIPQYGYPLVTRKFVDAVIVNKLSGLGFSDPSVKPSFVSFGNVVPEIETYQKVDWK